MKKSLLLCISILMIGFCACDKNDDSQEVVSIAKIKVTQNGNVKNGVTVAMFGDTKSPSSTFFTPFYTDKKVITDKNGIASFELKDVFNIDPIDTQTTFYFAVFDKDKLLGKTAITIKKGETKNAEINY